MDPEIVDVSLRSGEGDPVTARLLDISATGIGVLTTADARARLDISDFVEAEFVLPGHDTMLAICAQVMNHSVQGDSLRLGLEFAPARTELMEDQKQIIVDYVAQRCLTEAC